MNTLTERKGRRRGASAIAQAVAMAIVGLGAGVASPALYSHEAASEAQRALSSQLYVSPSQVRLVQDKLRAKGFDTTGQVDGIWGDSTTAAVKRFQSANGLAPTGQLDTSLLSALGIGEVLEGETSSTFLDGLLRSDERSASVQGSGAPLFVSPAHVAQIQHLLRERGFYKGEIDGVWGESTASAANQYRTAMGLDTDAGIDIALLKALNQQRSEVPKLATEITSMTSGVPLVAGPATLRALQRELTAKGHDPGVVDGMWGDNTRDAIRAFQRERDLEATGTLTLPTLAALGVDIKHGQSFESRAQSEKVPESRPASVAEDRRD